MSRPISEKQLAANRANAQKSTGPCTEEGRAAVRFNGLKHGLSAKSLCLPGDDPEELDAFLDNFEADFRPTNQTEAELVMQIAMASWRLRRFRRVEAAHFATSIEDHKSYIDGCHPEWNDDAKIAFVLGHADHSRTLSSLWRYQTQWERAIRTANQELRRIRKEAKQSEPAEVEEIKAPVVQIGFASQKEAAPPNPEEVKEPAARKFGFAPQKSAPQSKPPIANTQQPTAAFRIGFAPQKSPQPLLPTSNIQDPTSPSSPTAS